MGDRRDAPACRTTGSRSRASARPTPTCATRSARQRPGRTPLAWVAIESADEAEVVTRLARRAGLGRARRPPLDVLVRLNPDVAPRDDRRARGRRRGSKFGMTETEATALVEWLGANAGGALRPRGIHLHVGSQLRAVDAWRDAVRRGLAVVGLLRGGARNVRHARRGRRLPDPAARRAGARSRALRTRGSRAAGGDPRGSAADPPRDRARPGARGPRRAGSSRASSTSASGAVARSSSTPG